MSFLEPCGVMEDLLGGFLPILPNHFEGATII